MMLSDKEAEKWLAELQLVGSELGTISARLKVLQKTLDTIREKLL